VITSRGMELLKKDPDMKIAQPGLFGSRIHPVEY
jgi:hypothetical protein